MHFRTPLYHNYYPYHLFDNVVLQIYEKKVTELLLHATSKYDDVSVVHKLCCWC